MKRRQKLLLLGCGLAAAAAIYFLARGRTGSLVLTGVVTTDEVIVSSQIQGRLQQLLVNQGDIIHSNQLLGRARVQSPNLEEHRPGGRAA